MKLTRFDYANLALFFLMTTLVMLSYLNSGFYSNPSIQGHVVKELGSTVFTYGNYTPDNPMPYVNDNIVFYVTIKKDDAAVNNLSCKINIDGATDIDMPYSSLGSYTFTKKFSTEGIYPFSISCDLTNIGELNQTISDSINIKNKMPDFTINLTYPTKLGIGVESSFNISAANIGPLQGSSNVVIKLSYGDGKEDIVTKEVGQSQLNVEFVHSYLAAGIYNISAKIDSNDQYTELAESNNNLSAKVNVTNSVDNNDVCGQLNRSSTLTKDVYCEFGVTINSEIELNCDGHRINGESTTSGKTGIVANSKAIIRNCNIDTYSVGIEAFAPIGMYNNNISSTGVSLILRSNGNSIINNTFSNGNYGILNLQESSIQYNNFQNLQIYNINTSVNSDLSRNYFGTTSFQMITQMIKNSSAYVMNSYYDRSTLDPLAKLLTIEKKGPILTVKVTKTESIDETDVNFIVITDEKASCRYAATNNVNFLDMNELYSDTKLNHSTTLTFYDKAEFSLYFECVDEFGNPSNLYQSEKIVTRMPVEFVIDDIENQSAENKAELDKYKQRKLDLEDSLNKATNDVTKKDIVGDINRTTIDIDYFDKLYRNNIGTRDALKKLRDKINSVLDSITETKEKLDLIKSNITLITDEIDDKLRNDSTTIDTSLEKKFNYIEDFYLYSDQNMTKEKDRISFKDDYKIKLLEMEKNSLNAKREKYEKLMIVDNIAYQDIISDINYQYNDKDIKVLQESDDQTLNDLDYEIDMLKDIITLKDDLLDELDDLDRITTERADFASSKSNTILEQELNRISRDINIKQDETRKLITQLQAELSNKTLERSNFKRYYERIGKSDELILNAIETGYITTTNPNEAILLITYLDTLLDTVRINYKTANPKTKFNISFINNRLNTQDSNITFMEWFLINSTDSSSVQNIELNFSITMAALSTYNDVKSGITCFKFKESDPQIINSTLQSTSITIETKSKKNDEGYNYTCNLSVPGFYAIGYVNETKKSNNTDKKNVTSCTPEWICEAFTPCDPSLIKSQGCHDVSRCDESNLTYKNEVNCTPEEIKCVNAVLDDGEEGVDCGTICNKACPENPVVETPKPVEEVTKVEQPRNVMKDIIIVLILSSLLISGAIFRHKLKLKLLDKKSTQTVVSGTGKHDIELMEALAKNIFNYQDTAQTEAQFIEKKRQKESIEFYKQIIKYILKRLEMNPKTKPIIEELVNSKWTESDAKSIVELIASRFVSYHIQEFGDMFSSEDEKRETMMEMLGSEGFEPEIIDLALKLSSVQSNKKKDKK